MGTAATLASAVELHAAKPKKPMNVLYVFSDQHRWFSMGDRDVNAVISPNLEAFRRSSFEMEHCISNYPLCSPHRGILMSGRWPQQTGVIVNGRRLPATELGLGEQFRRSGYHTGYVGKWHLNGGDNHFVPAGPERFGFEDWHMWGGTNAHFNSWTWDQQTGERKAMKGYNATLMTDEAITFLNEQKAAEKPWMLVVSWNPPHPPYIPPEQDRALYNPASLKLRPNVRFLPDYIRKKGAEYPARDEASLREAMQGYYGGVSAIDHEFGRLLKSLQESGQAENTIVVYSCDHGDLLGSHGRIGKMTPHEESCRVPFFVRVPGGPGNGKRSPMLFSSVDIYPTVCGLAGIPVPSHCEGRDCSGAIRGTGAKETECVFLMANTGLPNGFEADLPTYRGLRTRTHTYAVMEEGRWCLYDNVNDPFQQKNLVADPKYKSMMDQFDTRLQAWLDHCQDMFPLKSAVTKLADTPFV